MWKECGPCPVFASSTLVFALELRKKQGKPPNQGKKNVSQVKKTLSQSTVYILLKKPHTLQNPHTYTHTHTHTYYKTI